MVRQEIFQIVRCVSAIAAAGGLHEADDYFNAALILQHSDKTEDYAQAHQWCVKAVELDSELPSARWLAAATQDRWLMSQGKPQLYGTQFKKVNGRWILWDVDPSVTDEERIRWEVPTLAEARKRAESMNLSFADLYDQASDLYEKAQWEGCADKFVAASGIASEDRLASRALVKAARCAARAGQKVLDAEATTPDMPESELVPAGVRRPLTGSFRSVEDVRPDAGLLELEPPARRTQLRHQLRTVNNDFASGDQDSTNSSIRVLVAPIGLDHDLVCILTANGEDTLHAHGVGPGRAGR